jgi:hypothetical protein
MLAMEAVLCHACKKNLDLAAGSKVPRNEECPYCYSSIHVCKMCNFYDSTAYNECRESSADRIVEKEKANFCDFFVLKGGKSPNETKEDLLKNASALFKF